MENDANLAAVGEIIEGAGQGCRDLVYVKLAPGIGSALVVGGRLYRGAAGYAGEIGHVQINEMGHPCVCGARGCLAIELYIAARHSTSGKGGLPGLTELFQRCDAGDIAARRVLGHIGELLGEQLGALANMIDPERVAGEHGRRATAPCRADRNPGRIRRTALPAVGDLPVIPSPLGIRAEPLGGIALARGAFLSDLTQR